MLKAFLLAEGRLFRHTQGACTLANTSAHVDTLGAHMNTATHVVQAHWYPQKHKHMSLYMSVNTETHVGT